MDLELHDKRALVTGSSARTWCPSFGRFNGSVRRMREAALPTELERPAGNTADIASVVALIASPLAGYVNGANYWIDGGSTISIN